jgi:hypothetical protein
MPEPTTYRLELSEQVCAAAVSGQEAQVASVQDAVVVGIGKAVGVGGARVAEEVGVHEVAPVADEVVTRQPVPAQDGAGALSLGGVEEEEA